MTKKKKKKTKRRKLKDPKLTKSLKWEFQTTIYKPSLSGHLISS